MKLIDLKTWLDSLPEKFLEYEVTYSEEGDINGTDFSFRKDWPINSAEVDEENEEVCLFNVRAQRDENNINRS